MFTAFAGGSYHKNTRACQFEPPLECRTDAFRDTHTQELIVKAAPSLVTLMLTSCTPILKQENDTLIMKVPSRSDHPNRPSHLPTLSTIAHLPRIFVSFTSCNASTLWLQLTGSPGTIITQVQSSPSPSPLGTFEMPGALPFEASWTPGAGVCAATWKVSATNDRSLETGGGGKLFSRPSNARLHELARW